MNYYAQPASVDYRPLNAKFLQQVKSGETSRDKMAAMLNDQIVLKTLKEDGLFRRTFTTIPITNAELDFDINNPDIPTKFEAVENVMNTYLVNSTDYLMPTEDLWFNSTYFKIRFFPMVSRKIKLTEAQILAAKYPVRQYLEAQIKNDFLAVEDYQMVDRFERCIAQTGLSLTVTVGSGGLLQKEHVMQIAKMFPQNRLSANHIIIHENTFYDIIGWKQSDVGSVVMADIVEKGVMGEPFKYKSYLGFKWLITNNSDIVPEKVLYATVPQRMLGVSYELQGPETYVEFRDGVLSIHSRQMIGRAIANSKGVAKVIIG